MRTFLPPVPSPQLPEWPAPSRQTWAGHANAAATLARRSGTGRNFESLMVQAGALLNAADATELSERLADRRFVRALVSVWVEDAQLARRTMTPELLDLVTRRSPSRLTTLTLALLFLSHFDTLDAWHPRLFDTLADALRSVAAAQQHHDSRDTLAPLRRHDRFLLSTDGPRLLADMLVREGWDLTEWMRREGLSGYQNTRFGQSSRDEYYLAQISAADAEQDGHGFLEAVTDEVLARQRTQTTGVDGHYFGHRVLAALTAKTTRRPSGQWLRTMLDIGDDPRMAQTDKWRLWWSKVPADNRSRAVRWMSGLNLSAFLDGVEAYAYETRNVSMQRMLERRKHLLNGLYEQDRIEDVRLVLGSNIASWIRQRASVQLYDVARLDDPGKDDTAVIYVSCGDFSLVEGSHNYRLHLFIGGPLQKLEDRRSRVFSGSYLRDELPKQHKSIHGDASYRAVIHYAWGSWIRTALDYLHDNGIHLDERGLMTRNDFADLCRRRADGWQ